MKVTVIGEGAWGTAIATVLAHNDHDVQLWCHDTDVASTINSTHTNDRYMPDVQLPPNITATSNIEEAMRDSEWIFEAIPVKYLRSILTQAKPYYRGDQKWVVLSKGIENKSLLYPSQILQDTFGDLVNQVVLSGPSLAREVVNKDITGVTLASKDPSLTSQLRTLITTSYFLTYPSTDPIGVQVGGALKNVITLAVGMASRQCCSNTQAWLLTIGFAEIVTIAKAYNANPETLYGLSGIGDLVLCATGSGSRNFEVGVALGQGEPLDDILKRTGYTPEGINTLASINQIINDKNISAPICSGLYQVVFEKKSFKDLLEELTKQ